MASDDEEELNLDKQEGGPKEGACKKCIGMIWNTRYTSDTKNDQELLVKRTFRELIIYLVFLIFVCIIAFGMASTNMYYYTKVMMDLFLDSESEEGVSFRTITSVDDFWKFAKGPLLDGLYWEKWYNGQKLDDDVIGYIYYENKLLGVPRLRQLRVSTNSCEVNEEFSAFISDCYATYSQEIEETSGFGRHLTDINETAWVYKSQEELEGFLYWGKIHVYSGAGYIMDLDMARKLSEERIAYLENNLWIQRGTRAVFISFTVYNANINLFCVITLLVEFPATGGAHPSWTFHTVKLIRYVSTFDDFILVCEIIFTIFIVYYIIEEVIEISATGCRYFTDFWNVLDVVLISVAVVCIVFNVYRSSTIMSKLNQLLDDPLKHANFENLGFWEMRFNNAVAITVFLAWVKVFKYISFNKTMTQLSTTLSRCAKDLLGFFIMFFIVFLAFTQLGYLLFGTQVNDFSTFMNSFFTLFRIILGDFDFHQLEQANRILGPIFFMLFVFFVFFVLINMFLAIINDTYSEVKSDMANAKNEFEIADYFKKGYIKMLDKLNFKRDKIVDIQKALRTADINQDDKLDFDEWRQDLKSRGYADGEIEAMFAKYDIDGDRVLDESEQKRMKADLDDQKAALNKEYEDLGGKADRPGTGRRSSSRVSFNEGDSGDDSDDEDSGTKSSRTGRTSNGVSYEEFTVLSRRVDRMEHSIGSIVSKIDAVLVKLEAMEKAKLKRRETMGKILDSITESDGTSDEMKREQMEKLVREELERWDSETSVGANSARGASPGGGSGHSGLRSRSRAESAQNGSSDV